jgi:single-strand DNA-binding protein
MNDVQVTLVGTITSDIRFARHGEVPVAKFRIRAQPRRFDKATNTWQDGEPSYYSAVAWRNLAEHVASSLGIGDPVLAHGRLRIPRWRLGDDPTIAAEVELVSVGHDLRWGTTVYRKAQPPPMMRRSGARGAVGGAAEAVGVSSAADSVATESPEAPASAAPTRETRPRRRALAVVRAASPEPESASPDANSPTPESAMSPAA